MSSQSAINVANLALLSLGVQQQISSFSEGSAQSNACATLFPFVFEQLARTSKWGCLNKQANLTLLQAAQGTPENETGTTLPLPQQPWLYGYALPSDSLFIREILPPIIPTAGSTTPQTTVNNTVTPWVGQTYAIPYEVGYSVDSLGNPIQVVFTDQEQAVSNYTVNQANPSTWDSLFTSAYVASLASYLVPALSLDKGLMQMQIQIADKIIKSAQSADGNENVTVQDHVPDWLRARSGATGYFGSIPGYNAYGNISMAWPL